MLIAILNMAILPCLGALNKPIINCPEKLRFVPFDADGIIKIFAGETLEVYLGSGTQR